MAGIVASFSDHNGHIWNITPFCIYDDGESSVKKGRNGCS